MSKKKKSTLSEKQKFVAAVSTIRELLFRGDVQSAMTLCEQAMSDALVLPRGMSEATAGTVLDFSAEFRELCRRHDVAAATVMSLPGPGANVELRVFGERSVVYLVERALSVEETVRNGRAN